MAAFAKVKIGAAMLAFVRNKAIDPARNEALRAFVASYIETELGGNRAAAAKAFDVAPSMISEFLAGTRGAGMKFLHGIAARTGKSIDELTGRSGPTTDESPEAGNAVGWREAEAECKREHPDLPEWAYPKARRIRNATLPNPVTPDIVYLQVLSAWKATPDEERLRLERERIEKSNAALVKRFETLERKKLTASREPQNDAPFLTPEAQKPRKTRGK